MTMKYVAFRLTVILTLILVVLITAAEPLSAQCAMCKASAEANLKAGGGDPRGLNAGILYILAMPYLLVAAIGYWWWRNRRQEQPDRRDEHPEYRETASHN
jgi:NADH:ubiquinone oxidoreductase subunit H